MEKEKVIDYLQYIKDKKASYLYNVCKSQDKNVIYGLETEINALCFIIEMLETDYIQEG